MRRRLRLPPDAKQEGMSTMISEIADEEQPCQF